MRRLLALAVGTATGLFGVSARASDFDERGVLLPDAKAVAFVDFEGDSFDLDTDYVEPPESPGDCKRGSTLVPSPTALSGGQVLHVDLTKFGCADRFRFRGVPAKKASYRATVWLRHGAVDAQLTALYSKESGLTTRYAKLAPTGRATSDGWVELASNELPVDGESLESLYLKVYDFDSVGSELDALELVPSGDYVEEAACSGAFDPVCGDEGFCRYGRCVLGRLHVPPLPHPDVRGQVVDRMRGLFELFFGARKTRTRDLPRALERLESLRSATSAWAFWNGFALAVRELHDWHTRSRGDVQFAGGGGRLNACFIAGVADVTALYWPRDPMYDDVLVSHVGKTASGLAQGDRLVAIDGQHPVAWALGLKAIDWGFWQACDDRVFAEAIERLRELIPAYARTITYFACDAASGACEETPRTVEVATLVSDEGYLTCDNRPAYYLTSGNPGSDHDVGYKFYEGAVAGTAEGEKIRALIWDTLYGSGEPNGYVNSSLKKAYAAFKANARGVILDHRAGNGGTLDGAETATTLMRGPGTALVFRSPIDFARDDGPATEAEGLAIFNAWKSATPYSVGSSSHDPALPVAVLLHRDGSASDFFPYGIKGASPKVRIFGAGPTAGAFSTYYTLDPPGSLAFQLASGDSIGADGSPLLGHGVEPDEVVLQRQSDLVAGRDTMVQRAVDWLRTELKP
ncbi:MAG: hypothetical protein FJ095_04255 [Deltaproteobacteria bacterium]|nr:hypothetical protein [Deltaproteobacteria bacterium]